MQSYLAWERHWNGISHRPKFKGIRNKVHSIPFPDPIRLLIGTRVGIPGLGKVKFYKQDLPKGKIKCGRIVKRASGWYIQLTIDTKHTFKIKENIEKIGIDTGFKHLAILSNGKKIENQRFFAKLETRLGQAQRGNNKQLTVRLHERIANQRKNYNHKISRQIVENFSEIYITNDNLNNQQQGLFGKSVNDVGISKLRNCILYKGDNHGRTVKLVDSKYTTMTCSACLSLTGPIGLSKLNVRNWECSACGAHHDRDVNAAMNVLNSGLGCSLVNPKLSTTSINGMNIFKYLKNENHES